MRAIILFLFICSLNTAYACSSFGVVSSSGTIVSKNRDYFYSAQRFEKVDPIRQFEEWYGNNYKHNHKFYALISKSDVKFGVNEQGLVAIEEDPPFPSNANAHRMYKQPLQGYSEGMVLYGILQNFSTVDEIIPYIDQIFSTAAPNFYQIADKDKILSVEVAYGTSDSDPLRPYNYKVLSKKGDFFTHTNTYLTQEFAPLNKLAASEDSVRGSNHRLEKMTQYVTTSEPTFSQAFAWYLDTSSKVGSPSDSNFCLNTSLFRSHTKDLKIIDRNTDSDKIYGTVSSFMVKHMGQDTLVYVRILNSIKTTEKGDQEIAYDELVIPLDNLFKATKLDYKTGSFTRRAPVAGVCL